MTLSLFVRTKSRFIKRHFKYCCRVKCPSLLCNMFYQQYKTLTSCVNLFQTLKISFSLFSRQRYLWLFLSLSLSVLCPPPPPLSLSLCLCLSRCISLVLFMLLFVFDLYSLPPLYHYLSLCLLWGRGSLVGRPRDSW